MSDEHPEATLRGRMIREVWDSTLWMTYRDAEAVVDALLAMPELSHVLAEEPR